MGYSHYTRVTDEEMDGDVDNEDKEEELFGQFIPSCLAPPTLLQTLVQPLRLC